MHAETEVELSIVMPCLNEAETLAVCIKKAQQFLVSSGTRGEVVVGDNGSTDGSQEIARQLGARVVNVTERGYGAAIYAASAEARGKYIIVGDSDDSYDFTTLTPFLEKLREGYDLVMGNRFLGGIKPGAMPWKNRYIGNPILTNIGRLFFRSDVKDFHCGLRGYSAAGFRRMDLRTTGMEFASEMVIKSTLLGLRTTEVPTTLGPDGRSRPPHLRPWRDGWRHLRFMLLYSPRWLFLVPGVLLMLGGFALGAWIMGGPRRVGTVVLDVHTLLYSAGAVLLGYQMVIFAMLMKVFAIGAGLMPEDPRLNKVFRFVTLEVGLLIGAALFLAGVAGTVVAVMHWRSAQFGPLEVPMAMRLMIPSFLALCLGVQTVLASFFLSALGLRVRRRDQ